MGSGEPHKRFLTAGTMALAGVMEEKQKTVSRQDHPNRSSTLPCTSLPCPHREAAGDRAYLGNTNHGSDTSEMSC